MNALADVIAQLFRKGGPEPVQNDVRLAPPMSEFPSSVDADFAKKNDASYAQPWAPYVTGATPHQELSGNPNNFPLQSQSVPTGKQDQDRFGRAATAINASVLAQLGFDPSQVVLDKTRDPRRVNILGTYEATPLTPKTGTYLNPRDPAVTPETPIENTYSNAGSPSNMVHEAIHRGVRKLRQTPQWRPEFSEAGLPGDSEDVVRYLMNKKMGNPETGTGANADRAIAQVSASVSPDAPYGKDRLRILENMEAAASQYIANSQGKRAR